MRGRSFLSRRAWVALGLVAGMVWPAVSVLGHGGNAGAVHGCVGIVTGLTRIVGPSQPCLTTETAVDWGVTGPAGPAGPPGPQGPQGPAGPVFRFSESGYVWANNPTAASYTPELDYQWNSSGGTNTITRTAVGRYTVNFPGLPSFGGHVQVTAHFGTNTCNVGSWLPTSVNVICFDRLGNPVDTTYNVLFVK